MFRQVRSHLTYANVMATIAVFVALGGSSYAALRVGSREINNNSVRSVDLRDNGVRGKDVRESSLGTVPRARDASLLGGLSPDAFLRSGAKAVDADKLDGLDSAAFLRSDSKAADADMLDGLDSAAFGRAGRAAANDAFRLISQGNHDCTEGAGPSVTVDVGPSGLVAVYAEASMAAGSTDASRELRVQLHEPTALPSCETIMRRTGLSGELRRSSPGTDAGTTARGSWLLFRVPAGERTFSLRYGHTGNAIGVFAFVQSRYLAVQPL